MANATHQTIKLRKGSHRSPADGACVMELASMLAGEPFSDHPRSACPVIGTFLRAYNDSIDDQRRQDLYAYAAKVVDSRASEPVEQARAERVRAWRREHVGEPRQRSGVLGLLQKLAPCPPHTTVGASTVHAISTVDDELHARVLALIDELLAIGGGSVTGFAGVPSVDVDDPVQIVKFGGQLRD